MEEEAESQEEQACGGYFVVLDAVENRVGRVESERFAPGNHDIPNYGITAMTSIARPMTENHSGRLNKDVRIPSIACLSRVLGAPPH